MAAKPTVQLNLRIDPELYSKLEAAAKEAGETKVLIVKKALNMYLTQNK